MNIISMILYIGMGWCIIFTVKIVFESLGTAGFLLLLAGILAAAVIVISYLRSSVVFQHLENT